MFYVAIMMSADQYEFPFHGVTNSELVMDILNGDESDWKERLFSSDFQSFVNQAVGNLDQLLNFDYYTDYRFSKTFSGISEAECLSLSVFHLNIRSLNKNYMSLLMLLENLGIRFDIIALSEIRANNLQFLHNIMPGYKFHYNSPTKSDLGGSGIFVRDSLTYHVREDIIIDCDNVESCWLEIDVHPVPVIVGCVYRHPGGALSKFNEAMDIVVEDIVGQHKSIVLTGDLIINLLKYEQDNPTSQFLENMLNRNIIPMILMPTRFGRTSNTLIDHIYYYNNCRNKNYATQSLCSGNLSGPQIQL